MQDLRRRPLFLARLRKPYCSSSAEQNNDRRPDLRSSLWEGDDCHQQVGHLLFQKAGRWCAVCMASRCNYVHGAKRTSMDYRSFACRSDHWSRAVSHAILNGFIMKFKS